VRVLTLLSCLTINQAQIAPSNTLMVVAAINACAVLLGALLGAGAAILSQRVSQGETTRRETAARRLREERVRALFVSRVKMIAFHFTVIARGRTTREELLMSLGLAEEAFEVLAREFAIHELTLALEAKAIEAIGLRVPSIQNYIRFARSQFESDRPFDDVEKRSSVAVSTTAINTANVMLESLNEPLYQHPEA
jgi:hypothetical protein